MIFDAGVPDLQAVVVHDPTQRVRTKRTEHDRGGAGDADEKGLGTADMLSHPDRSR